MSIVKTRIRQQIELYWSILNTSYYLHVIPNEIIMKGSEDPSRTSPKVALYVRQAKGCWGAILIWMHSEKLLFIIISTVDEISQCCSKHRVTKWDHLNLYIYFAGISEVSVQAPSWNSEALNVTWLHWKRVKGRNGAECS